LARFDLLVAIDLRGGRVVRLRQGDFDRETSYSDDPVAVARAFVDRGAAWLHVVDLDGARAGEPRQAGIVAAIVAAVADRASVEVAGGLRTVEAVDAALEAGARRAIVGTAALADPSVVARLVAGHGPERIGVALDVRDGEAVGHGWAVGGGGRAVAEAIVALRDVGVRWFEVTAIDRDGTLAGPDLDLLQGLVASAGAGTRIVASGGIRSVEDMLATWTIGCAGAIVGRSLYEGTFELERAVRATAGSEDARHSAD
jgi:phosphoribosylformimino-5-aminoimidazole carboxamide ribotide isomerase